MSGMCQLVEQNILGNDQKHAHIMCLFMVSLKPGIEGNLKCWNVNAFSQIYCTRCVKTKIHFFQMEAS